MYLSSQLLQWLHNWCLWWISFGYLSNISQWCPHQTLSLACMNRCLRSLYVMVLEKKRNTHFAPAPPLRVFDIWRGILPCLSWNVCIHWSRRWSDTSRWHSNKHTFGDRAKEFAYMNWTFHVVQFLCCCPFPMLKLSNQVEDIVVV